ncbi:unnamed protein product [Blepharisma stoltei]|uniref:CCHC-type domain-containing protein n=1 Tax=Blepharisma stoltei TaxID=1481888 RepID=A0AAU9IIZ3_9CILI|nr:unnamed protein product [Blepharisma stoltei]
MENSFTYGSSRIIRKRSHSPSSPMDYSPSNWLYHRSLSSIGKSHMVETLYPNIEKLKNRKSNVRPKISREMALEVVKKYLLPMFDTQKRATSARKRVSAYGMSPNRLLKDKKPLEKLSDLLKEILSKELVGLEKIKNNYEKVVTEKNTVEIELNALKEKLLRDKTNLNSIRYMLKETDKRNKFVVLGITGTRQDLLESKSMYEKSQTEKIELENSYYKEKNFNMELKEKSKTLLHWNDLYRMRSDIMGERLKGFFESCTSLLSSSQFEDILSASLSSWKNLNENLNKIEQTESYEAGKCMWQNFKLVISNYDNISSRQNIKEEVKKLRFVITDYFNNKKNQLKREIARTKDSEQEFSKKEKEFNDFNMEYEKMKERLKALKAKHKAVRETEEKLCKKCRKPYFEKNNYNWSCSTHGNIWNGQMYWCCGNTNKESSGCQRSKHENQNLIDSDNEEENPERSLFCSNCKKNGHSPHKCPKDPNARSNFDFKSEINRIKKTVKNKRKMGEVYNIYSEKLKGIFKEKFSENSFGRDSPRETEETADQSFSIFEYSKTPTITPKRTISLPQKGEIDTYKSVTPDISPISKKYFGDESFPFLSKKRTNLENRLKLDK